MGIPPPFAPATAKSLQRYLGPLHVQSAELQGLQDRPGLEMTNIPDRITQGFVICHWSFVIFKKLLTSLSPCSAQYSTGQVLRVRSEIP